jgi:hypothetical protein
MAQLGMVFPATAKNSPEFDYSANRNWTKAPGIEQNEGNDWH